MQPGGYAILSGILNEQADDVLLTFMHGSGFNLVHRERLLTGRRLRLRKLPELSPQFQGKFWPFCPENASNYGSSAILLTGDAVGAVSML